jgi:hypothetical protein
VTAPIGTLGFIAAPVTVTVGTGKSVEVISSAALGSTAGSGAGNLNLYIGYQLVSGGPVFHVGAGEFGLTIQKNQRADFTLSAVITGLAAGQYKVGLVGQTADSNTNWNFNDYSYTTALVN